MCVTSFKMGTTWSLQARKYIISVKLERLFRNVLYLQEAFEMTMCNAVPLNLGNVGGLQWSGEPKRLETEASSGQQLSSLNFSSPFDLNFPLPGEKGPSCLVKVRKVWRLWCWQRCAKCLKLKQKSLSICVSEFSLAAVTNCYKFRGLKITKFIILEALRQKSSVNLTGDKMKVAARLVPLWRLQGAISLSLFQLLEACDLFLHLPAQQ